MADDNGTEGESAPRRGLPSPGRGRHSEEGQGAFGRSAGWTVLGTLLPGLGLIKAGHRRSGGIILAVFAATLLAIGGWALLGRSSLLATVVDPTSLRILSAVLVVFALAWVSVVVVSHLALRPRPLAGLQRGLSALLVGGLAFAVAAPMAVAARYSYDQADVVGAVFKRGEDSRSATRPTLDPSHPDPWANQERLNVLLLGGDGDDNREGIRTDTAILASIDTHSGDTTLFSLPRNTARMPFPADSELGKIYPQGFYDGYDGENLEYVLFSMYNNIPRDHPGAVGETDNEGADVMKLSVGEALGLDVDYYALVNLDGFSQLIDALGGVTVNINTYVPVGGDTDRGIYPDRYLAPGPDQHLDGGDALWFARGRYGTDDFARMERQRCVIGAVIDQANPQTILTRYEAIARASKDIIQTDIPQELLPALLELAFRVKDGEVRSVLFQNDKEGFVSADPNWFAVRARVDKALRQSEQAESSPEPSDSESGGSAGDEPTSDQPETSAPPTPEDTADPSTSSPSDTATPGGGLVTPSAEADSVTDACAFDPVAAAEATQGPTRIR